MNLKEEFFLYTRLERIFVKIISHPNQLNDLYVYFFCQRHVNTFKLYVLSKIYLNYMCIFLSKRDKYIQIG